MKVKCSVLLNDDWLPLLNVRHDLVYSMHLEWNRSGAFRDNPRSCSESCGPGINLKMLLNRHAFETKFDCYNKSSYKVFFG